MARRVPVLIARRTSARRVLVATDGSPSALATADLVGRDGFLADAEVRVHQRRGCPDPVVDGHVGRSGVGRRRPTWTRGVKARVQVATWAAEAAARIAARGLATTTVTREGDAAAEILAEALAWGADLVVVGSRRNDTIAAGLLGSVSRNVIEHAQMSVLVAGRHEEIGDGDARRLSPWGVVGDTGFEPVTSRM